MKSRGANPYVGPRSFLAGERLYGRDREIDTLYHQLLAERIVLLYSPSGAGKSSLIQAGLIPRLVAEGFRVRPPIRVGTAPPPGAPAGASRFVQAALLSLDDDGELAPGATLASTLADQRERSGIDTEVLVFDQFEEVLTVDPADLAAKQAFFRELGAALRDDACWAVFAMREDFIAGLDPYRGLVPHRLRSTFRLDLLGLDAAIAAIRSPAEAAGVAFSEAAARQLAEDLAQIKVQQLDGSVDVKPGHHVEPVQLQVVCHRLWERLPADAAALGLDDVRALGDVDDALAGFYDAQLAAVATATSTPERALRSWLGRNLVTPQGLRTQVLQTPESTLELANAALWKLVDGHLLRTDSRRGMIWFELAHDRMVAPMRRSNAAWLQRHTTQIQQQAALWHAHGRPERLLISDPAGLPREDAADLTPLESTFVASSREVIARVARLRRYRRTAMIFAVVAAVLVIVGLVGGFITYRKYQARKQQAIEALASARGQQALTALARQLTAQALLYGDQRPDLAALLAVAAATYDDGWTRSATLLAAVTRSPQLVDRHAFVGDITRVAADARGDLVLLDGAGRLHARAAVGGAARPIGDPSIPVFAFAVHPTRPELAFIDPSGQLHEWDAATGRLLRMGPSGLGEGAWSGPMQLAYAGSGARLALLALASPPQLETGADAELVVRDQADASVIHHVRLQGVVTPQLAVSPNGDVVVTGTPEGLLLHTVGSQESGAFVLPRVATAAPPIGEQPPPPDAPPTELPTAVIDLAFTAGGDHLLALTQWGSAWLFEFDGATLGAVVEPIVRDGSIEQLAIGGGDTFAVMVRAADGDTSRLELWSSRTRRPLGVPIPLPHDSAGTLAFVGPERRLLTLASPLGAIAVFDPDRERTVGAGDLKAATSDSLGTVISAGITPFAIHDDPAAGTTRVAIAESRTLGDARVTLATLTAGRLQPTGELTGLVGTPQHLLWSASGREISAITEAELVSWDVATGARTAGPSPTLPPFNTAAAYHGDQLRTATAIDGAVQIGGAPPIVIEGPVLALGFDPAGEHLAIGACVEASQVTAACVRSSVIVVDAATGRPGFPAPVDVTSSVFTVAVARGGGAVASAGSDGNLVVARPDGTRLALTARRGVRLTEGLAFSADGRVLAEVAATASPSRAVEVRLWDLTTGEPLVPPWLAHDGRVVRTLGTRYTVAFAAGDTALLTVAADGVMAWPLDAAVLRPRVCAAAGREFTPAEWQRFFGAVIPPQPLCAAP